LLETHLYRDCLGSISEIFDGLDPERGKGGFAMAWSSGELIRALALLDKVEK
jgi:glycogen debranching enzyme